MNSIPQPSAANIALAPELAVLHVLDAALAMAVETLVAAHSDLATPTCPEERLAQLVADQARKLRKTICCYFDAATCIRINGVNW